MNREKNMDFNQGRSQRNYELSAKITFASLISGLIVLVFSLIF